MTNLYVSPTEESQANQYAETICDELNVKQLTLPLGTDEQGRKVIVEYRHDTIGDNHTPLDCYVGGEPQGKTSLAAMLFLKSLEGKDSK